jgi:hypothetical protein
MTGRILVGTRKGTFIVEKTGRGLAPGSPVTPAPA